MLSSTPASNRRRSRSRSRTPQSVSSSSSPTSPSSSSRSRRVSRSASPARHHNPSSSASRKNKKSPGISSRTKNTQQRSSANSPHQRRGRSREQKPRKGVDSPSYVSPVTNDIKRRLKIDGRAFSPTSSSSPSSKPPPPSPSTSSSSTDGITLPPPEYPFIEPTVQHSKEELIALVYAARHVSSAHPESSSEKKNKTKELNKLKQMMERLLRQNDQLKRTLEKEKAVSNNLVGKCSQLKQQLAAVIVSQVEQKGLEKKQVENKKGGEMW